MAGTAATAALAGLTVNRGKIVPPVVLPTSPVK
jgi:hypothetical protein